MTEKRRHEPWHPPRYSKEHIRAVQAIARYSMGDGTEPPPPSPRDCKIAMDWLIHDVCDTYGSPFRPNSGDVVNYALGQRSVGLAWIKMLNLKPEIFDNE